MIPRLSGPVSPARGPTERAVRQRPPRTMRPRRPRIAPHLGPLDVRANNRRRPEAVVRVRAPDRSPARPFGGSTSRIVTTRARAASPNACATRWTCPTRESLRASITRGSAGIRAPPRPESSPALPPPSLQPARRSRHVGSSAPAAPARSAHGRSAGVERHAMLQDKRRADSLLPANRHPHRLTPRAYPVPRQPPAAPTPEVERLDSIIEIRRRKQPPQELLVCRSPAAHRAQFLASRSLQTERRSRCPAVTSQPPKTTTAKVMTTVTQPARSSTLTRPGPDGLGPGGVGHQPDDERSGCPNVNYGGRLRWGCAGWGWLQVALGVAGLAIGCSSSGAATATDRARRRMDLRRRPSPARASLRVRQRTDAAPDTGPQPTERREEPTMPS